MHFPNAACCTFPMLHSTGTNLLKYFLDSGQCHKEPHLLGSLPFNKNISTKKEMWKCRHSSENSILHSTEPLQSLLNDPFYHGAMSLPFWIVRPGKKNRCMYTSGWVMYYSSAVCSFWQTDLIKGKKAIHCVKKSLTGNSELEAREISLLSCFKLRWVRSIFSSFERWWC